MHEDGLNTARSEQRLAAVRRYDFLRTFAIPALGDLVRLAAQICATRAAAIHLIESNRDVILSEVGLGVREIPLERSLSLFSLTRGDVFVVDDLASVPVYDSRRGPRVRFFAAVPLCTPDGHAIGALSVCDHNPRHLDERQVEGLRALARQVMSQLELHRELRTAQQSELQDELVETRRRLESALIAGEVGTYEWEVDSDRLWGDPNFDRIFRVSLDPDGTAPLARFVEAIHPDDRAGVMEKVMRTVDSGEDYIAEYRVIAGDETRWVIARGRVTQVDGVQRFHGVVLDITARRHLEEELARSSRITDSILSTTDDFAYLFDLDGNFLFANRSLLQVWGKTLPEIVGKNVYQLGYPEWHADMHMREIREVIEQKHAITGEVPYTAPTGIFGVYEYIFSPVFGPDGEVEVIAGTTRDVTFRKQAEEVQRGLAEQLRKALDESSRLLQENERLLNSERAARAESDRAGRMKDEFLATLSHELRTPLSAILGWSGLLKMGDLDASAMRDGIAAIERSARAQAQLVDDLLEMSRIISGKVHLELSRVNIADVVSEATGTIRPAAAAKDVTIVSSIEHVGQTITGDASRLQQVFWNLLSNAVKFTPRGGRVEVRVEERDGQIEITVEDTGEGIDVDFLPYIFDRFRQADASITRRHAGLGLGLAIVKQLVELHGGSVRAWSEGPGQGATFRIALPMTLQRTRTLPGERVPVPSEVMQTTDVASLAGLRVLVVDDEEDIREVVQRILQQYDSFVRTSASAKEAIEVLAQEEFDVLVSDIGMPGEDGYTLMRRVRELHPGLPAIALTAYARPEDRERVIEAGSRMHVAKPVQSAQLVNAVASVAMPD